MKVKDISKLIGDEKEVIRKFLSNNQIQTKNIIRELRKHLKLTLKLDLILSSEDIDILMNELGLEQCEFCKKIIPVEKMDRYYDGGAVCNSCLMRGYRGIK